MGDEYSEGNLWRKCHGIKATIEAVPRRSKSGKDQLGVLVVAEAI